MSKKVLVLVLRLEGRLISVLVSIPKKVLDNNTECCYVVVGDLTGFLHVSEFQ